MTELVATPPTIFTLWMERQFSGTEIATRMMAAAAAAGCDLRIVSTPKQKMANSYAVEALPWLRDQTGIDEVNKLIAEHRVNALWVRKSALYDLSGIECGVHVPATPDVINLTNDKAAFTESLDDDPTRADTTVASTPRGVAKAYKRLRRQGKKIAVKPADDGVNGFGYWHLTEGEGSLIFSNPDRRRMHPKFYIKGLKTEFARDNKGLKGLIRRAAYSLGWLRGRDLKRILVMEWLPGPEVSIDILCWDGEPLMHAARVKASDDVQVIKYDHPMVEHARALARKHKFHGIISVQYRCDKDGNWKILEINPRPAGGCIHSEDAGFKIITYWTYLVLGIIRPEDVAKHQFRDKHGAV